MYKIRRNFFKNLSEIYSKMLVLQQNLSTFKLEPNSNFNQIQKLILLFLNGKFKSLFDRLLITNLYLKVIFKKLRYKVHSGT